MLLTSLGSLAARDDDMNTAVQRGADDLTGMDEMVDYQSFHISFTDILMVIVIIAACYVFGKIWKGCTYMIIAVSALFYFLLH